MHAWVDRPHPPPPPSFGSLILTSVLLRDNMTWNKDIQACILSQEMNDALLTVLMSSLTKGSNQMLEYVEKVNLAYSRP